LLKKSSGACDIELFSYNFNMHRDIIEIIPAVGRLFFQVSLLSQRIDSIVRNPSILEAEFAAGKRSFTLGIEGISQRMRNYYQKGLITEQVRKATISILERNARELKLFYIIAGLENSYDIEEFKAFCEEIARFKEQTHTTTRVIVSVGYLVRLPFTPLNMRQSISIKLRLKVLLHRWNRCCELQK